MIGTSPVNLLFQINNSNWPISISYFSLLLAFLLSSIIHIKGSESLYEWVEMVVLIVSGWVFILAGDYWSILIGWTLIDFVELIFHFRHKVLSPDKFYFHFLIKFLGSLILIFGISRSFQLNPFGLFEKNVEGIGLIIPLAAFLHSGISSNFSERSDLESFPNKMIIFLKIISFITSFFLLIYLPQPNLGLISSLVFKIFLFGFAILQMYKWASVKDEIPGIRKLLLAFGSVLCLIFFSGLGEYIEIWLILLIVPFGWLYLYTDRDPKLQVFLFLSGFFLTGIPFSLTFQGLFQLSVQGQWIDLFFVLIPMTIALSGFINHGLKKSGNFDGLEPWYQVFYLIGLFFPLLTTSAIVLRNPKPSISSLSSWWIGLSMVLISSLLCFYQFRAEKTVFESKLIQKRNSGLLPSIIMGFQFFIERVIFLLDNLLLFFSSLFEADGGILWSIVFLVLFITILNFQGGT
ncbi:MAG: hypothetical protein Q7J07_09430 [Pelolinea sp.]|nr:hypothetical protein [Pelolinea sp.]